MSFYREHRVLAVLSSAFVTASLLATPTALAAERTPAEVAQGVAPAVITQHALPVDKADEGKFVWRDTIEHYHKQSPRVMEWWAYSPSMDRQVPLVILKANESAGPRPTIYMLNGGDGGEGGANWVMQSDAIEYYYQKNVNVVMPMAGQFSYYTDWVQDVPHLGGPQRWETFLTKELPGPVEAALGANNDRAIIGMSMSATSSLLLAEHNPHFYDAVGSFSGCAETSHGFGPAFIDLTLARGGVSKEQMWGSDTDSKLWKYNDALLNAGQLKGTAVYVSNGSGFAGFPDLWSAGRTSNGVATVSIEGGIIEAGTNKCTHDLQAKMDAEGVPATFNFRNRGTHSWPYWQQDLRASWPVFARAFGLDSEITANDERAAGEAPMTPEDVEKAVAATDIDVDKIITELKDPKNYITNDVPDFTPAAG